MRKKTRFVAISDAYHGETPRFAVQYVIWTYITKFINPFF